MQASLFHLYTPQPQWGGHNGYPAKLMWLIRAMHRVKEDADCFNQPHYWLGLGMTQSMAESMLFWAEAFKLIEPTEQGSGYSRKTGMSYILSDRARLLLEHDPYFESSGIIWVLHWWMLSKPCLAKGFDWFFSTFRQAEFDQEQLRQALEDHAHTSDQALSEAVIKDEVRCILRTYLPMLGGSLEEEIDCPFQQLRLLAYDSFGLEQLYRAKNPKAYAKAKGKQPMGRSKPVELPMPVPKLSAQLLAKVQIRFCFDRQTSGAIPSDVLVYACLEYIQSLVYGTSHQSGSMALSRLLYGESSPGLIFKVPESGLHQAIDQVFPQVCGLHLVDGAGIPVQMAWSRSLDELKAEVWQRIISR